LGRIFRENQVIPINGIHHEGPYGTNVSRCKIHSLFKNATAFKLQGPTSSTILPRRYDSRKANSLSVTIPSAPTASTTSSVPTISKVDKYAGILKEFINIWSTITNDRQLLDSIKGYRLPFLTLPVQKSVPVSPKFNYIEENAIDKSLDKLLRIGAIQLARHEKGEFISNIFVVSKPNGDYRLIINLKQLNAFLDCPHFKMEDYRTVCNLLKQDDFLATLDLKDAYHLIPVHEKHCKYLRFIWKGSLYEYT